MGRKTPFQIICLLAFGAFAAVSCYLTVDSIHLSLPNVPRWCFWIAIVGLYVLTSYGTKMIMDSFNRNIIIDKRGAKLVGGLIIVLITWLLVSFPTNVHSLFYLRMAKPTAKSEQLYFINQFKQLTNEETAIGKFNEDFTKKVEKVNAAKTALEAEIEHPERPGVGDQAERCLQKVENELGVKVGTITRLSHIGRSQREINTAIRFYSNQIATQLKIQEEQQAQQLVSHLKNFRKEAGELNTQIANMNANISNLDNPEYDEEKTLAQSRQLIRTAAGTLSAKGIKDDYKGYRSERLTNVTEVWSDMFKGEFKGKDYGLIYWILFSLVIDLAAFCFFNVAFKEKD